MTRYIVFFVAVLSMANLCVSAEPNDDEYNRIARIAYMEGNVSFQGEMDVDWSSAAINFPLQPGDRLYSGPGSRAEIEFDEGSVLRLAESTDIQFLSLRENLIQVRVLTGLLSLTVTGGVEFEVDTPAAAFVLLREGTYRFDTEDNGDTNAIVRKGELEAISHRFVRRVRSGERIFVNADENSTYSLASYSGRDAWDEWTDRRNADRIVRTASAYIPDNVYVGASELDRHGRWVTVESYGAAWVPFSVGVSWSPYSIGRWCYRPLWGWTWVSYESWGWLPYHYGRWYHSSRYGWCWLPGASFTFNFWSPGLVTFYSGPSWVSWCPLGPGDYYSFNNYYYNRRLFHHQVVRLKGLHRRSPGNSFNRHVRGAFQTVDLEHFRGERSHIVVTSKGYRMIERPWKEGRLARERLAVRPTAKSFSPDPDRHAIASRIQKPRAAVVFSKPSAKAGKRDAFVRIENKTIRSQAESMSESSGNSVSNYTGRNLATGGSRASSQERRNGSPKNSGRASVQLQTGRRSDTSRADDRSVRSGERTVRSDRSLNSRDSGRIERVPLPGDRGKSERIPESNLVRGNPQVTSRQYIDRSRTERSTTSRDSIRNGSSSRVTGGERINNRSSRSSSDSRIRSKRQNTGSSRTESVRVPRSNSQSAPRSTLSNRTPSGSRSSVASQPSSRSNSRSTVSAGRSTKSSTSSSRISSSRRSGNSRSSVASQPSSRSSSRSTVSAGRSSSSSFSGSKSSRTNSSSRKSSSNSRRP